MNFRPRPPEVPSGPIQTPHAPPSLPLRERKKLRARSQIIESAYALFDLQGFAAVTVSDIVEDAEVSRSTFFRYFGDKQEVVFAHEHLFRETLVAEAYSMTAPAPGDLQEAIEQLRTLAVGAYRSASASPRSEVHERLLDANPELLDRHIRKLMGFAADMVALLVARGCEPTTARLAAHLAIACCLAARGDAAPGEMHTAVSTRFDQALEIATR